MVLETQTALVLEGRTLAKERRAALKADVAMFTEQSGVTPGLGVVLVGDDAASVEYTQAIIKAARNMGMYGVAKTFPTNTTAPELAVGLAELNNDPTIHGISVQWPLPKHISMEAMTNALDPRKDVEGYHPLSTGRLYSGLETYVPPTPLGGMQILDYYGLLVTGKNCLVYGCGVTVGKPLIYLLLAADATIFAVHSRTPRETVRKLCLEADFIFMGVGKPKMLNGDMIKSGAVVVDFGTSFVDGAMVGDIDFESVMQVASAATPTPGGTSVMTTVILLENVLKAAQKTV